MDRIEHDYHEIISYNKKYLPSVYSKNASLQRKSNTKDFLSGGPRQLLERLKLRELWKKIDTVKNNIDYYSEANTAEEYQSNDRIAVYTCIIGMYDKVIEPLYIDPSVDYFIFTDLAISSNSAWKKIDVTKFSEYNMLTPTELNRKIKFLPHQFLPEYQYSIYIDGVIRLMTPITPWIAEMGKFGFGVHYHNTRDCIYNEALAISALKKANSEEVAKQISSYEEEGFPHHFGMFENTVLIRNHKDRETNELMEKWWDEYRRFSTRDQLSLPYIIWKKKYPREKIYILGMNLNNNPRLVRELKHRQ